MSYFDRNMNMIKSRDIVLYDQVQLQQDRPIEGIMSELARDGNTYLKRYIGGEWIALNSTYKPLTEAEKFAKAYEAQPLYARLLVFGLGNGYFARAIIDKNPLPKQETADGVYSHVRYAFYEPDYITFLYVLHTYDLTDLLGNPDVSIFVEGLNENLLAGWCNGNVAQLNASAFQYITMPKYKECYKESYERISHVCEDMLRYVLADTSTKITFAKDIVYNNYRHLSYYLQSCNFRKFAEHYPKELPYIIVSAGPSLRQNIDELRAMQEYSFVMATDSAALYLMEQHIIPDGIITIDPLKPLYLFSEEEASIPFFVHTDSNVKVLDRVRPEKIYYVGTNMVYYERLAVEQTDRIPYLDTGGGVATAAFSLALEMGIHNIVLIGQDLNNPKGQSHVAGQNRSVPIFRNVPGNVEEQVATSFDYYMYLQWFQNQIAAHRELHVINATLGGAKIEGAEYLHGDALVSQICTGENKQVAETVRAFMKQAEPRLMGEERTKTWTFDLKSEIDRLIDTIHQAISYLDEAELFLEKEDIHSVEFEEKNRKIAEINKKLVDDDSLEWLEFCAKGRQDEVMTDLYQQGADEREDFKLAYEKMRKYYSILLDAAQVMNGILEGEDCERAD